jgi:two-component system, OmpR family, sensor kinase
MEEFVRRTSDVAEQSARGRDGGSDKAASTTPEAKLLSTLEQLLHIDSTELDATLDRASDLIAGALQADKIDIFLYDASKNSLVARGTSRTPMGILQHQLGLDRLPIVNDGPEVGVFQTGQPYSTGAAEKDPTLAPGYVRDLGIRSMMVAPLDVGAERRGVITACSSKHEAFSSDDFSFLGAVSRWISAIAHRAELMESTSRSAAVQARQVAADELVTVLAHDLRNYMSPLKGRLDIVRLRARREGRQRDLVDLDAAARSLNRLQVLIQDLLDIGKLDQGLFSLSPEPVDLVALIRDMITALQPNNVPIALEAPEEVVAEVDPQRVRQAVENLISNAVKHSLEGGSVTVEIRVERQSGPESGDAIITVQDQGPGIPGDLLSRVFDRFVTGPGSRGLGLGLYLARSIAEAHKGTLTVESSPGRGTKFTMCFPLFGHTS